MSLDQNILVKLNKAGFSLNNKWLVKDVSLQVEKGKIVTLIGPNGSGKSTTAKIALGIYKKIDGSVEKYTNKVGYVPQKISIDWTLPLRVNDFMVLTENLNKETIDEALSLTGVIHLKDKNLGDLSGTCTGRNTTAATANINHTCTKTRSHTQTCNQISILAAVTTQ